MSRVVREISKAMDLSLVFRKQKEKKKMSDSEKETNRKEYLYLPKLTVR